MSAHYCMGNPCRICFPCIDQASSHGMAAPLVPEFDRLRAEVRRLRAIEEAAWEMDNDIDLQMRASPDVYELWKCALAETKRRKAALAAKENGK